MQNKNINQTELKNVRFNYNDDNVEKLPYGVDFQHLGMKNVNTLITNIDLIPKGVECEIKRMNFIEQSGFKLDSLSTIAQVSPEGIYTQKLKIKTANSRVDGKVEFMTEDYSSLANFIDEVKIQSNFKSTKVNFKDISYFAPALEGVEKWIRFDGEIKGKVSNLKARKFSFVTDDRTRFAGKIDISGLPSVEDMFMHIDVKEFVTTKEKVETFPMLPFKDKNKVSLPSNFRHLGAIRFKGSFTGFYHDFVSYGTLRTNLGSITTDLALKLNDGKPLYKGKIKTNHFNLGRFFEMSKDIGDITMNVDVDGTGFTKEELDVNLTGDINQVVIKGYEYNNVDVKGNFKNKIFSGYMAVEDENIAFDFDGNVDLSKKVPEYHFISNIKNAKLGKLNLVKSEKKLKTRFSTRLEVNLIGDHVDNLIGDITISDSRYNDRLDSIKVDKILITSLIQNNIKTVTVKSDLLDARLQGQFYFKEIGEFMNNFFVRYIPSQLDQKHQIVNLSHDINFNIELHNSELLSKLFLKGVEMSDHTVLGGKYNSTTHLLTFNGDAPFINAYGLEIKDFSFNSKADEAILDLSIDADRISLTDTMYIDNFNVTGVIENDSALTELSWNNIDETTRNEANFIFNTVFEGYGRMTNSLFDSYAL